MRLDKNHLELSFEAASLLSQVRAAKLHHGEVIPDDVERMLTKMEFLAENIAGEAGAIAALRGSSKAVPQVLLAHRVLVAAFVGDYSLEFEHQRLVLSQQTQ